MTGPEPGSPGSSGPPVSPDRRSPRPRLQTVLFLLALLVVAAVTTAGVLVADHRTREQDEQEARDAAAAAATSTEMVVERVTNALAGAGTLVRRNGTLDENAFPAFASSLQEIGPAPGAALLAVVDDAERAEFEELNGPILERRPDGALVAAGPADVRYPLLSIEGSPGAGATPGLDYGSDPVLAAAAAEAVATGQAVMTPPIELGSGDQAVMVLQPIAATTEDGTDTIGIVAVPILVRDLEAEVRATVPAGSHLAIDDGDTRMVEVGQPTGGRTTSTEAEAAGRTWRVTVDPPPSTGPSVGSLVLVAGSVLWVGLLGLFVVTLRYQRRLGAVNSSLAAAEQRSRTLERLASRLARALSSAEVGSTLLEGISALTGASSGAVVVRSASGDQLELVAAFGYDEDHRAALERVPLEWAPLLAGALEQGEAEYLATPAAWEGDSSLARFVDSGMAAAVVPLLAGDEVPGLLVVCQPVARTFDEDERSLLESIGAMAGRALVRSLRYDAEHAASVAFQRASLPATLPEVDGVATAARYRPATSHAAVGGDWYDVVLLTDGRVAVVVGDVVGHGATAAAAMGHLRSAVRVLATVLPEPGDLLPALTAEVASLPDAFGATMAYGVLDPTSGTFQHVLAGHLPPLVVRAGGGAEVLDTPPWPPLGVAPDEGPDVVVAHLEPGDTVLLYTDGVVERRGESLDVGLERLREAAASLAGLDPDALCDALLEAAAADDPAEGQGDDVALVALRLLGDREQVVDLTESPSARTAVDQGAPPAR